jgi:hypothetical protein
MHMLSSSTQIDIMIQGLIQEINKDCINIRINTMII